MLVVLLFSLLICLMRGNRKDRHRTVADASLVLSWVALKDGLTYVVQRVAYLNGVARHINETCQSTCRYVVVKRGPEFGHDVYDIDLVLRCDHEPTRIHGPCYRSRRPRR